MIRQVTRNALLICVTVMTKRECFWTVAEEAGASWVLLDLEKREINCETREDNSEKADGNRRGTEKNEMKGQR